MARGRKPEVNYDKRHEWLKRYRGGESPQALAKADGFDVRTVRKNIAIATREVETGEARTLVYRDALKEHQADLVSAAARLDAAITAEERVAPIMGERILAGLKEHLPGSRRWRPFEEWDELLEERLKRREALESYLKVQMGNDPDMKECFAERDVLSRGITQAMLFQAEQWSKGKEGLGLGRDLHLERGDDPTRARYGAFDLGLVTKEELDSLRSIVERLESILRSSDQCFPMKNVEDKILSLKLRVQDDLALITMRRIVPGSCRYCPD